jgi:hypothetical protein
MWFGFMPANDNDEPRGALKLSRCACVSSRRLH